MIIPDLDDLVLVHDGEEDLEELGRRILSEGPWGTVAYLVRTRAGSEAPWEGPFLWLHRYQRVREGWKLVSRFRTTERRQLDRLLEALREWSLLPED
jgi:hypothetical protein